MVSLRNFLPSLVRILLLGLCLCSLIAFLFAQNEHYEGSAKGPLDVIQHAGLHFERENHIGSLNPALNAWDGTPAVIIRPPFIRKRLGLHSLALSPLIPPPKHPSA
jgi:hypothetical protein